jgi:lipopolysaccharide transport system ATP-binding protein
MTLDSGHAIRVEGLSKRYWLGSNAARDAIRRRFLSWMPGRGDCDEDEIWSLSDVSFDVARGEAVGIIGANGAGKSTLLKILSRITEPTSGCAAIRGSVGSLLEVGTGFHPELTGRENIHLNGALLGMRSAQIRRHFDAIVDFSGVENFIDTPVKRYSTGMRVRLAFAVSAHLEPEILIIDEVLAVGDVEFQRRCLGKMESVARHGRTVLFVSHNLGAITKLCSRALLLEKGKLKAVGDSHDVVAEYLQTMPGDEGGVYRCSEPSNDRAYFREIRVLSDAPGGQATVSMTQPLRIEAQVEILKQAPLEVSLQVLEQDQRPVLHTSTTDAPFELPHEPGLYRFVIEIPPLHLYPGTYRLGLYIGEQYGGRYEPLDRITGVSVSIEQDFRLVGRALNRRWGLVYHDVGWRMESMADWNDPGV